MPFGLTIHLPAEGLDEGSNIDIFEMVNTEEKPFLFVIAPATNILWILPVYFCDVQMPRQLVPQTIISWWCCN